MYKSAVSIKSIGTYVPENIITNYDLSKLYNTDANWPETHLGISQRRWANNELTSDLGVKAGANALTNSDITADDIDLLIVATSSPDRISPSTACIISEQLGLTCPCFDINAVCSGFIYSLNIATALIKSGAYKNIMLIATETYSNITDKSSRDCVYFGDGAAAIILSKSKRNGWISTNISADGTGKDGFSVPIGGTFKMNGKAVFDTGTKVLPISINKILNDHGIDISDIKYLVPHQPGIKMLHTIADKIGLDRNKVITVMDEYANTAGASIPLALNKMLQTKNIQPGDYILLATVGSGWTWGVGIIQWE